MSRNLPEPAPPAFLRHLPSTAVLDELARSCGLMQRRSKKLSPRVILAAFLSSVTAAEHSFFGLSSMASLCSGFCISRQALHKRFGPPLQQFLSAVLARLMAAQATGMTPSDLLPADGPVRRILAQDSVSIALHPCLRADFPGSGNQHGSARASLKIQVTLDLLNHQLEAFTLSGFNRNDQAAAPDILTALRPGDLVLRDLGYFTLESLEGIAKAGAFFVSRYSKASLFHPDGVPIDLGSWLLKKHRKAKAGTCLDIPVLMGADSRLAVRFVAVRLAPAQADERRRRALNNRDARLKPTHAGLALLDWALYVTNLPAEAYAGARIATLYSLRWRIEILFKSLKSQGLRLPVLLNQPMDKTKLEVLVESAMILVVLHTHVAGVRERKPPSKPDQDRGEKPRLEAGDGAAQKRLSLLKSTRVMRWLLLPMLIEWLGLPGMESFQKLYGNLAPTMNYEKRSRSTFLEDLRIAFR